MSVESRAAIARRLIGSLDDLTPEENERLWAEGAARRYRQLKAGTTTSIPSEEVFARLDARHRGSTSRVLLRLSCPPLDLGGPSRLKVRLRDVKTSEKSRGKLRSLVWSESQRIFE